MVLNIGKRIHELRRARGLTQRALADRAGLYHTTISEIERGVTVPSARTLEQIAEALDMELADMVRDCPSG